MYQLIRPFLFALPPEAAHHLTLSLLDYLPASLFKKPVEKPVQCMGLSFPHAVGLAAGLDKNAAHLDGLAKLGFAFIEVGTITPRPQEGNPKPRLFRIPQKQALINRMGFNNHGVDVMVKNIQRSNYQGILGINIGKNKTTPLNSAAEDYLYCLEKVYPYASYITVNISSPNTPDLRQLQQKEFFSDLLTKITLRRQQLADEHSKHLPLLVKISPDETSETLKEMVDVCLATGVEGMIATNTTTDHQAVAPYRYGSEQGGVSGKPLLSSATSCLEQIRQMAGDSMRIIAAGGIDSREALQKKQQAGADLFQVYTGLIYQGPSLIADLVRGC